MDMRELDRQALRSMFAIVTEEEQLENAWQELQSVPSYVERHQRSAQCERQNDNRMELGEKCDSCGHTYCTCDEWQDTSNG